MIHLWSDLQISYRTSSVTMDADMFNTSADPGAGEEEEYEEELTAAEVMQKLEDAWVNEKHAPELLESKIEIVECMLDQVKTMEENLTKLQKGDIRAPVHRMEIQRIKFMVNSYLRLRISKIQKNIYHITRSDGDNPSRMTPEEAEFAAGYRQLMTQHYESLVLRHLPGAWDPDKVRDIPRPPLDSAVFVAVKKDVAGVEIKDDAEQGNDDTVDLVAGSQHMFQYRDISHLLESEHLLLI